MKYYIKSDITNEYLIDHYKFKKVPHIYKDIYNLEYKDKEGLGLQIWWKDRNVNILLGNHATFGIAPIPKILMQLCMDDILIYK